MRTHPHLFEINTWPWLTEIGRRLGRAVTLGSIPDREWERLKDSGIDIVYLLGIWRRSRLGRDLARAQSSLFASYDAALPGWHAEDVVGSAFSISAYEPDPHIGSWDEVDLVRDRLHARGMQLIVDFIPNHTAFDHRWLSLYPDRYVSAPEDVYRQSPSHFRPIELPSGEVRFIACARDPYFPPWTDVAQLNYSSAETRAAMVDELRTIAQHADGARCDMAMLVLSDVFSRTWGALAGPAPVDEFWPSAVRAVPGFTLLAEVYWDLDWRLQQLGFHFTYDKSLYDRLLAGSADGVYGHLTAEAEHQRRSARFIENHDEARSIVAFDGRVSAAAVAISTLPGLRFYHDGQFEGRRVRVPVQLGRSLDEPANEVVAAFYRRLLSTVHRSVFHDGAWKLRTVRRLDDSSPQILAWQWRLGSELILVVVNLGTSAAQAAVAVSDDWTPGDVFALEDLLTGKTYTWHRTDLEMGGLYVRLDGGQAHVFSVQPA
jgi:hypothetical protein